MKRNKAIEVHVSTIVFHYSTKGQQLSLPSEISCAPIHYPFPALILPPKLIVTRDCVNMKTKPNKYHSILWADDDADDLFIVREVMESIEDKHQMVEAFNGRQALDYLHSIDCPTKLPCLIVLDINMPILNGKETLSLLKSEARFQAITVIVFTTSSNEKDRLFCERFGAKMYTKPNSYSGFEKMVASLLSLCEFEETENAELN